MIGPTKPFGCPAFRWLLLVLTSPCLIHVDSFSSQLAPRQTSSYNPQLRFRTTPQRDLPFDPIRPISSNTALNNDITPHLSFTPSTTPSNGTSTRATAVYALMLLNLLVFVLDKVVRHPIVPRQFYLFHRRWKWWQPLTACFCHVDRRHLCNNLFLLLLFGRSVEDDQGWPGLVVSYVWSGIFASLVSLWLLPRNTVSIGASGAVFGLFAVSTLAKVSWNEILDWRKLVEMAVLGEFVFRQITTEIVTAAGGGRPGINHVAHLSGALGGALLVFLMRVVVTKFDPNEAKPKLAKEIKQ
jgi:membrane associated rhomboid family serine protease